MGVEVQFLKKRKFCLQNLAKDWKQPSVVILQQVNFCNIFILCSWLRIIRRSNQGVQFMIFFNNINHGYKAGLLKKTSLWLLSFYMDVASCCYYKKARRTMGTGIVLHFHSFSVAELNNIGSEDEVFAQEFLYEESDF